MTCPHCQGAARLFGDRMARRDRKRYLKKGPRTTTRLLVDRLARSDVRGATLLDIGGGVGAVAFELFDRGLESSVGVDAADAFVAESRREAEARGLTSRMDLRVGDFIDEAGSVERADLVALDRVICCYPDVEGLLELAGGRARRALALVAPRDLWWLRPLLGLSNAYCRLTRNPFRIFVHPWEAVDRSLRKMGLRQESFESRGMWAIAAYVREP